MPTHLIKRIQPQLDSIYPPFLEKFLQLLANCESQGYLYPAISGYRSKSEQAKLYFQGRTTPGNIVTNARPGTSWHNWGCSVDVARDIDVLQAGLQPTWDPSRYLKLKEEGEKLGLQVGVPGKHLGGDCGHVQWVKDADHPGLLTRLSKCDTLKEAWAILDSLKP